MGPGTLILKGGRRKRRVKEPEKKTKIVAGTRAQGGELMGGKPMWMVFEKVFC